MKNIILFSFLIIPFSSCSAVDSRLDIALFASGSNSLELQKVLNRYKDEDTEKYKAACFLIRNYSRGKDERIFEIKNNRQFFR